MEPFLITQRRDGSLRLNFKQLKMGPDFQPDGYAMAVANELMWALEGLVGEA